MTQISDIDQPDSLSTKFLPEDPAPHVDQAYAELRWIAASFRRQVPHETMQTTEIVHEAYLRLVRTGPEDYPSHSYFFACAGRAMYALLMDRARKRAARKRGGDYTRVPMDDVDLPAVPMPEYEELRDALERLGESRPYLRQVLELRFFLGMSIREIAAIVKRGESTVRSDSALASAWLKRELTKD